MTDPTKAQLLDEIRQYIETAEARVQPGDLTFREIRQEFKIKQDAARALMLRLCDAGLFERIDVCGKGFKCVFRRVK